MGDKTSTRLGEVLADKGVITYPQLHEAMQMQRDRRYQRTQDRALCLGEILIELGYINRYQLRRGLNWQSYLRKLTLVVALCAPLMTIGCGDGTNTSDNDPIVVQPGGSVPDAKPTPPPQTDLPEIKGPVDLNWSSPTHRENGDALDITELGGYELRYRLLENQVYTHVLITDPWTTEFHFDWLEGNYEFQIAAYDKTGMYSDFVNLGLPDN